MGAQVGGDAAFRDGVLNPGRGSASRRRPLIPLLPARWRAARRPQLWEELLIIGVGYWLYSLIRNTVPTHLIGAFNRGHAILRWEHWGHLDVEKSINTVVAKVHVLSLFANYWYATMHFIVTIGVLVWLWRCHPERYRTARAVLALTNFIALIGYWGYSLAPPRMLADKGFVDTVVRDHMWGSWGSGGVETASNQFAAMPSMHIGWAVWCAVAIVVLARRRWVKVLGAAYPVITLLVIVGTANHYVLDAVGGICALGIASGLQRLLYGRPAFAAPRSARSGSGASALVRS